VQASRADLNPLPLAFKVSI